MNILILVSSLNYGGAEKQAVLDANMLAASAEHQVYVGAFESGALQEQLSPKVNMMVFPKKNYFFAAAKIAQFVRSHEIQLVHNHLYAPMIIAALSSLLARVPVLWHFHGHHFEVRRPPLNILSRLPTVKRIIFVCSALAGYFDQNFGFPSSKTTVVYNSSQCKKLPSQAHEDEVIRIGFIGRVVKLKRLQYLVHLANYLKENGVENFEILIVGDGPEREKLESLASELKVEAYVKFLGFRSDIEQLYNQFDLFVLPSEEEALSLSLIDAGNCGLPSIAFDVGGNKEIVQDGKTGYIVHSEEELQQKALQLCVDKDLRHQLGAHAEQYTKLFSEEQHLEKLLDIYQEYA